MIHQPTTLQIATFGSDGQEGIALGIRSFPIHSLALICFGSDKHNAEEFSRKIRSIFGITTTINVVEKENVIRDTMERVNEILNLNGKEFQQVLMNISAGDKLIGCAALSAAFALLHNSCAILGGRSFNYNITQHTYSSLHIMGVGRRYNNR
jgi:hypothetical protein